MAPPAVVTRSRMSTGFWGTSLSSNTTAAAAAATTRPNAIGPGDHHHGLLGLTVLAVMPAFYPDARPIHLVAPAGDGRRDTLPP